MSHPIRWQSSTAALMAIAITTGAAIPLVSFAPALAQGYNLNQSRTISIRSGATLPVTYEKEKVIVKPGETLPLTLRIADNITDSNRNILIPINTEVIGELQPVNLNSTYSRDRDTETNQGVRFVARELIFPSGQRQQIFANSQTITQTETISEGASTGKILTDAAIGAGAATVISLLTGNKKIEVLEPVGGAAAGALASVLLRKEKSDVFVLRPDTDLAITLTSNLVINRQ
ncbi:MULTISPECIES: conjugal transfer protein TrbI [unclassified Anabaena]|uniref:conjugal transfer protein TrbI n=1 Tax=unclassified Anabaena TaxID=2619674 RepID=UPI001445FB24|nr:MULTISPECIES: conjugal transfer protein TrbI [unclassified Anabaena]MTJ09203.1 conjugal transfer protein TrbI [Anabaena sp. UHCC 0204]MTJ53986.1 conjugal transfer protein TrbI [Anabaena sp. UHCC 0253]